MAYDVQKLIEKSRKHGGPEAEKMMKANWKAIKEWLAESAAETPNPIDDAMVAGLGIAEGPVMKALDQIDGIVGN